jgi:Fur family ferric uptake transcriptional regulator
MKQNRPSAYSTQQGRSILDYMASMGNAHVTACQILRYFKDEGVDIGQTTIYRHLEKLTEEGKVHKYVLRDGQSACYQYADSGEACRDHFHLKCEICGRLIHLDCELLNTIQGHVLDKHDFEINMRKTVFYGKCEKCKNYTTA